MTWVTELVKNLLYDITKDIWEIFGDVINKVYALTLGINNTTIVKRLTAFTSAVGIALIIMMVIKQMIGTYALETEGDSDRDPLNVLYRVGKCIAVILCNSWLFDQLIALSYAAGRDIDAITNISNVGAIVDSLINSVNGEGPAKVLCVGVILIGYILFFISATVRGAELTLDRILLPVFAVDIINSSPEKWNMFFFQYVVSFFSYLVQYICFNLMLIFLGQINMFSMDFSIYFMITIGWLVMTLKSPQALEKYIYATGTGKTISNGASRLGQVFLFMGSRR